MGYESSNIVARGPKITAAPALLVWVADLAPGTYTWAAVHTVDEGAIMATIVVQS